MKVAGALVACALAGVVAVALGGCKRTPAAPPGPRVVEVVLRDRTLPSSGVAVDAENLRARAAKKFLDGGAMPILDGGDGCALAEARCYKLAIDLRAEGGEDAAAGSGVMRAHLDARLEPIGGNTLGTVEQKAIAEREYKIAERGDAKAAWAAHLSRAVDDVAGALAIRARLVAGDARALAAALDGSDEDLRDDAITAAAERRERAAVPSLIKLLKSDDHDLRDAAIGALGAIGDPRAVRPLTEVAHFRDLSDLPKVLDALAAIGGGEARNYLEFVASGHDNPAIRELAKESLAHLDRRTHPNDLGAK